VGTSENSRNAMDCQQPYINVLLAKLNRKARLSWRKETSLKTSRSFVGDILCCVVRCRYWMPRHHLPTEVHGIRPDEPPLNRTPEEKKIGQTHCGHGDRALQLSHAEKASRQIRGWALYCPPPLASCYSKTKEPP
jgi:hypothetical protein